MLELPEFSIQPDPPQRGGSIQVSFDHPSDRGEVEIVLENEKGKVVKLKVTIKDGKGVVNFFIPVDWGESLFISHPDLLSFGSALK